MQESLQQAYQHIKAGRKAEAKRILLPLCRANPNSLEAWWMLSFAVDDPKQMRYALNEVLRLDPLHEQAFIRLAQVDDSSAAPVGATLRSPLPDKSRQAGKPRARLALPLLLGIVVIAVLAGGMWQWQQNKSTLDDPIVIGVQAASETPQTFPSLAVSLTPSTSPIPPSPTVTFSPSATPTPPPTLPPTWTPSATFTDLPPSATLFRSQTPLPTASFTPWPTTTPLPTVDASWYAQTYWDGDGTDSMENYSRNGYYLRHFEFPIYVYYSPDTDSRWLNSINYAINLLGNEVPMRRTQDESQADILVVVMSDEQFMAEAPCANIPNVAGCGGIQLLYNEATQSYEAFSKVLIRQNAPIDTTLVVHEMIHALGVYVHSPNKDDVMYFSYSNESDGLRLTQRDKMMIRLLYSLPAYGEDQ